ncbi:MAG: hypothetical protein GX096_00845 [Clostridiales bacterium]|nr:hypothetical protein [Clostridiales bacterium]
MKKKLSLFLMLACILCLFAGTAQAEKLDSSEAEDIIFGLFESNFGYSRDQLKINAFGYDKNTGIWTMSALLIDCPQDEDGLFLAEIDNSGNIAGEFKASEKISLSIQMSNTLRECNFRDDCYMMMAKWTEQWTPMLDTLIAEDTFAPEGLVDHDLEVLKLGVSMPAEGSISFDKAWELAKGYIMNQSNWSMEAIELYRMRISCYYTPADIGKPVYFFYYATPEYTDKNKAKLKELFGETYPLSISLMVDAVDGSLVETPIQAFPGEEYFYLDCLIRTDAIIEAGQGN